MNRAREELKDLRQLPGQPISSYMYKYGRIHFLATGNQAHKITVRDHTGKSFMPKYKTDYHVIRVLGNNVEVKDNNGKMSWFHISDVKKTDMITKLICQLPDYNERYPTAIMEFIESLNPKLMRALVKKHADPRTRPQTLQQAFNMAEEVV